MDKSILRDLSYGMYLVSSKKGDKDVGCIANSAMQITSNPITIAVSINKDNYTHSAIEEKKEFVLSVLPEEIDSKVIGTFGFQTSRDIDKFEEMDYELKEGYPILTSVIGYIRCKLVKVVPMGTHTIFIGEAVAMEKIRKEPPMTYAYYHAVKKGNSPKNAPTYQEETVTSGKKRYVCTVCGYVYEGDLPEDFVCPICGVSRELFEEVSE